MIASGGPGYIARPSTPSILGRYPEVSKLIGIFSKRKTSMESLPVEPLARPTLKEMPGKPVKLYCRPHEMFVARTPEPGEEYIPADVIHINPAGALVKLELQRRDGQILQAEVPKNIVDSLEIKKHDTILIKPKNIRVFE